MVLINAYKFKRELEEKAKTAALKAQFGLSVAADMVEHQPTAYDLDGVLERLREERLLAYDKCDGGASYKAYDKAINIVKGGVNNDK